MFRWLLADHGAWYGPTSGWIPDLTMLSVIPVWYHKHNCHETGCWRPGRRVTVEQSGEHVVRCRKHHEQVHRP